MCGALGLTRHMVRGIGSSRGPMFTDSYFIDKWRLTQVK